MRVLLCHNYYQQPGGEDQVFHDERALLEENGHEVVTFTRHNNLIEQISRVKLVRDTFWNPVSYQEVRRVIRCFRPELMHCTNVFPIISPAAYYAARAEGIPVVQSVHNYRLQCANGYFMRDGKVCEDCLGRIFAVPAIRHGCYRNSAAGSAVVASMQTFHRLLRTWQTQVDRFISCSEFARQKLIQGGLPGERITVKPNCVRPDSGVGDGEGEYAIFVGRLSPEKGIQVLLDAWSRLPSSLPLKIVGDGPLANVVKNAAAADPRIEWLGWRPLPEVLELIGRAACLLMTSVWYETFGRTIIEAFSKGTPAVVSRLGAMAELVRDGETGFLFNPGDADDLVLKVEQLRANRAAWKSMRRRCRAEFELKYTADVNYRQLIAIYEQVLGCESTTRGQEIETIPGEPVAAC